MPDNESETDWPQPTPEEPPARRGWSGGQLAIAALVVGIFIGGTVAALLVDDDVDDSAVGVTTTTGGGTAALETTTTVASRTLEGPQSPTTSTPSTTAVASGGTVTTSPATTAAPATEDCGNGSMRVEPEPGAVTRDEDGYHTPVAAAVTSQYDRAVEVTRLVVRVTFSDGSTTDVELDTVGVTIPPGDSHTYDGPTIDSESEPASLEVVEFAYREPDRPDCAATT